MAKRFIDSEIFFRSKWFRKLPPKIKLFWFYLITNCDHAGVWEVDFELAQMLMGIDLDEDEIKDVLKNKIYAFQNNEKWLIKPFLRFQYGQISQKSKPHQSVIKKLRDYGIFDLLINNSIELLSNNSSPDLFEEDLKKPIQTELKLLSKPIETLSGELLYSTERVNKGFNNPFNSIKDKEEVKEKVVIKEKNKVEEKEIDKIKEKICNYFGIEFIENSKKTEEIDRFINLLTHNKCISHFEPQFQYYIKYKNLSGELSHGFKSFLGSPTKEFSDGGWNAENWKFKYDNLKKKNNSENKRLNGNNTEIASTDEHKRECL